MKDTKLIRFDGVIVLSLVSFLGHGVYIDQSDIRHMWYNTSTRLHAKFSPDREMGWSMRFLEIFGAFLPRIADSVPLSY